MINVLFLPHSFPHLKLKTRTGELSRKLSQDDSFSVFVLVRALSLREDMKYCLKHCLSGVVSWEENRLTYIRLPYLPGIVPGLSIYNYKLLEHFISAFDISVVINSFGHSLHVPVGQDHITIYDLADDYIEFHSNPIIRAWITSFIRKESQKSDALSSVSMTLGEKAKKNSWAADYIWVPNGFDEDSFSMISPQAIDSFRDSLGFKNRIVIGHIGSQDRFSGLHFLLKVFEKARRVNPRMALMIVGPGAEADRLKPYYRHDHDIVFAGPIDPDEIFHYFLATDIGVLPYAPLCSTNSRFPLRLSEYIAARKIVVAWPFGDLGKLRLPNVFLAERSMEAWVDALLKVADQAWNPSWDEVRERFSWTHIVGDLKTLIMKLLANKGIFP